MNRKIKALVFTSTQGVEVAEFSLPECGEDEVVVRTIYSMISTGTELRVRSGKQDMSGDMPYYPVIPGYSVVGEIVETGAKAVGWRVGDLVSGRNPGRTIEGLRSTWGGHASYHVYPSAGYAQPVLLPPSARLLDYVAVELAAISGRGARAVAPAPGETAIVLGQGMIGALSAAWLVAKGVRVGVADLSQRRLKRAAEWGVSATFAVDEPAVAERISAFTGGGADIVVESSGTMAGVKLAGTLLRNQRISGVGASIRWPRLLFQASYTDTLPISPTTFFTGEGAVVLTPGDRSVEDRNAAVEAFRTGTLRSTAFVDHIVPYTEAASAYDGLRTRPDEYFSVVFDWTAE
ncbi:MAG: zinc-binding dehydrogenase [Capsulimonadaceae bacterium]|nr:zinc-binding dehydrogenase [Capsulimonadaceae bacterium]